MVVVCGKPKTGTKSARCWATMSFKVASKGCDMVGPTKNLVSHGWQHCTGLARRRLLRTLPGAGGQASDMRRKGARSHDGLRQCFSVRRNLLDLLPGKSVLLYNERKRSAKWGFKGGKGARNGSKWARNQREMGPNKLWGSFFSSSHETMFLLTEGPGEMRRRNQRVGQTGVHREIPALAGVKGWRFGAASAWLSLVGWGPAWIRVRPKGGAGSGKFAISRTGRE